MTTVDPALDLPLNGTHLIEASAGTGKTYTIAGLYLRCVVERQLSVSDILVVTFTRAATEELKDRLRKRLSQCADSAEAALRGVQATPTESDTEEAFARALIDRALAAGEAPAEVARSLRLAAVSLDEAAILTIHAFCQRVLREQAFASGEALDPGELIGSDADLIDQIAADYWRRNASDCAGAADFDVLLGKVGSARNLATVLRTLADPDRIVWPQVDAHSGDTGQRLKGAITDERKACERLLAAWTESGEHDLAQVVSHAADGHLNRQTYKPERVAAWVGVCCEHFALGRMPPRAGLEYFGAKKLTAKTNKNKPSLPCLKFPSAIDEWLAADQALCEAQAQRWPALLADARTFAQVQLDQRKQRAARQSYDDLIRRLHTAISDPTDGMQLAARLNTRYPFVFVDEFQDTDALQFEIFRRMQATHDDGALFLVGDPKQAIYRFRGGDIEAYLRAAAAAPAPTRLSHNFRSSPGLLEAIDAVFTQGDRATAFVDPRIDFPMVAAGGHVANEDVLIDATPIVPLTCWHLPDDVAPPNKGEGRELLANGCAEAIVRLLAKARGGEATIRDRESGIRVELEPRNIAVLVTTNDEATLMQEALAARGIASATIRQESVFSTAEGHDLLALLAALESHDEAGLRTALASRLFGFDARAIATFSAAEGADGWQAELQRLDALEHVWRRHGVLAMFEQVFEAHAAAILDSVGGERRMSNYLQLAELLQRESAHQFGALGLIEWLRRRIDLADKYNEDEQLHLESDADRVQIATIHVSKGLEYDLIFLPFTALRPGQANRMPEIFEWHAHAHRNAWVQARGDDASHARDAAKERSEWEQLSERVRVLYVALTRARYACWLSWDVIGKNGEIPALAQLWHGGAMPITSAVTRAALERLAKAAPGCVRSEPLPRPGAERIEATDTVVLPPARRFDARIDTSWWTTSFSQLRDGRRSGLVDAGGADDEGGGEAVDAGAIATGNVASGAVADWPRGALFGTAMHEILERADFSAWRDGVDSAPVAERETIRLCLRRHALAAPEQETELLRVVARMIGTTLNACLPENVRLVNLAETARRAEMPFHFAIAGADVARMIALLREHGYQQRRVDFANLHTRIAGLMTGIIDLVYLHDARWWIVDYKTNYLGPRQSDYAPDALAEAVREHDYDLQYIIYTLALHRWLKSRLGNAYDYERDFGGALYLFLRGLDREGTHGVHVDRPPRALIEELDTLLAAEAHA